jgi:diphthamide synthase subunit DPH2
MLTGFNTSFEDDMYRFQKLKELGVKPYVMVYNDKQDERLQHFERWVNSSIYTACSFNEYIPWQQAQKQYELNLGE